MDDANPAVTSDEEGNSRPRSLDAALIAGGIALFLVLLYTMREFLNPLLVGAAGVILLWPLRSNRAVRALLVSGAFLLILWFFDRLSTVLLPFGVAYLLAYLFNPVVDFLNQRFKVPRWASSLVVTGLIIGLMASFAFLLIPSIINQLEVLGTRIFESVSGLSEWLAESTLLDRLQDAGIVEKQDFIAQIIAAVQEQAGVLASGVPEAAQKLAKGLGSILGLVTVVAIMPVLVFYMVKDFSLITDKVMQLFPTFGGRREYLIKAGGVVGNYLRGQLMISAIAAVNVSVLLLIFDVPFALLIGLLGGLLNMIPNVGAIITNIIGVTIAIVFGDPWLAKALVVFVVLLGEAILESSVLSPQILSHQVGLHPVLIVLSLFVFGAFMGLLGLFIAVPVTALIVAAYRAWHQELQFEISNYMSAATD